MKKKRFLSILLKIVMLVSTLAMSGCGTQKQSANGNLSLIHISRDLKKNMDWHLRY